ncbi:MAG: ABC transporter permease subunit [Candidatus Latescibacterota bacterium]|nr:MAG: ABC transporter permease subunit [Candidatus Latescibacterota bacterium]
MIPTMLAIITITFFIIRLAPGGPFMSEREIPREARTALNAKYGLDEPLLVQYGRYIHNVVRLDFGPSYKFPSRAVRDIIFESLPVSLELGIYAILLALLIGIPVGSVAALKQNTVWDYAPMSLAMLGVSIPNFVLGPMLIFLFALTLRWLPPALWGPPQHKILPALTLAAIYIAYIARLTRGGMLEITRADFMRTARAKGLPEATIVTRHALRGGLLPVVSFLGPAMARAVTGSIVVEKIFAVPGVGQHFVNGAFNRDYTLVMGVVIFYAGFLILFNLVVDLAYAFLDPRVKLE